MKGHGFAVDWWTLGVLIYEMVTGRPPFMHSNHHRLGQLIKQGVIIFPHPDRHGIPMSEELKDIVTKLLDKNPASRLGSQNDADEIVNHPWFKGMDWDGVMKKTVEAPFVPDMEYIRTKKSDTIVHADDRDGRLDDGNDLPGGLVKTEPSPYDAKGKKKSKKQLAEEQK